MSLNKVSVVAGALLATGTGAFALSNPQEGDNINAVKNITAKLEFSNLCASLPQEINTLKTEEPIANGDNVVIKLADNSINEFSLGNVSGGYSYVNPIQAPWSGAQTEDADVAISFSTLDASAISSLHDDNTGSFTSFLSSEAPNIFIIYAWKLEAKSIESMTFVSHSVATPYDMDILGSNTGAFAGEEVVIGTLRGNTLDTFTITMTDTSPFWYHKVKYVDAQNLRWILYSNTISVRTGQPFSADLSAITQGETPTKVYKVDDSVEFNDVPAVESSNAYTENAGVLLSDRTFNDVALPESNEVTTKVNLSATGNKMTELSFDLYT